MFRLHTQATEFDHQHLELAIRLALEAESEGNMPIGSVIAIGDKVIASGRNRLLVPDYNPGGHAEIDALQKVDAATWASAAKMTCYSSLEPCVMCTGSLILHGIRRVVFGALDQNGGGRYILDNLPPYYEQSEIEWIGPLAPLRCNELYQRALSQFTKLPCGQT